MGNIDLVTKINAVVRQEKYSERDIVYFLVEACKYLERKYGNELGRGKYDRLKFYRDWACHSVLHGASVKIFTDFAPFIRAEQRKADARGHFDWLDVMAEKIRACFRGYSPPRLKDDLLEFLKEIECSSGELRWESFRESLYQVIRDIPLVIKDGDDVLFTFECAESVERDRYDDLHIQARVAESDTFTFVLDDHSI